MVKILCISNDEAKLLLWMQETKWASVADIEEKMCCSNTKAKAMVKTLKCHGLVRTATGKHGGVFFVSEERFERYR